MMVTMTACNQQPPSGHPFHGTGVACHADRAHTDRGEPHTWEIEPNITALVTRLAVDRLLGMFPGRHLGYVGPCPAVALTPEEQLSGMAVQWVNPETPWFSVKFAGPPETSDFAIWRRTGETFQIDEHGAVIDEPSSFLPPIDRSGDHDA